MAAAAPTKYKVWNIAAIHADGLTWSTQLSGTDVTSMNAKDVLIRHIAERHDPRGAVVVAVIADTDADGYSASYFVDAKTGEFTARKNN